MYSDNWHEARYTFEEPISVADPVYYRHVYDHDGKLVGVIVDCELADDFHYELLGHDWIKFSSNNFINDDETESFRAFLKKHKYDEYAFENALNRAGIRYNKAAFLDWD